MLSHFNSLAPCGANQQDQFQNLQYQKFQLTRPVRGEPRLHLHQWRVDAISTHSPRAGRTLRGRDDTENTAQFQLTRPVRGEPVVRCRYFEYSWISTHSPRAGRTRLCRTFAFPFVNFNSLAPCGANLPYFCISFCEFQLTRPVRGEPGFPQCYHALLDISTHSPRAGRTE